MKQKLKLSALCTAIALASGVSLIAQNAYAGGGSHGKGYNHSYKHSYKKGSHHNGGGNPPPPPAECDVTVYGANCDLPTPIAAKKYLIGWASDQMLDGNNCSALDDVLGLRGLNPGGAMDPNAPATPSSPADCKGLLPDADFIAILDADPTSVTYGQVINTAEMPGVAGQHVLSAAENFVDNALDIALGVAADGYASPGSYNPNGSAADDLLGGVPNMFYPNAGPLGVLPAVVPAPSSVLNEAHHHSVYPSVINGRVSSYYGGLISANVFGCDYTDVMNIVPAANTTLEDLPLHADNTTNLCGLAVSGAVHTAYSGTDDLEFNPITGNYFTTMMGAGAGSFGPGADLTLPPLLTTPGGLQEYDPATGMAYDYKAIPTAPVFGHGTFTGDGPAGTDSDAQGFYVNAAPGEMLGPKRYAPRVDTVNAGVDGNGECTPAVGNTAIDGVVAFNLCVPGVAPFNQLGGDTGAVNLTLGINEGPDTGLLTHPHGIGIREDLVGQIADKNGNIVGQAQGIIMISDYVDPVSIAIGGSGVVGANNHNLGTTIRLFDLANPQNGPYQVIQMPDGNRHEGRATMEEPEGLMAMRVTHGTNGSKGAFVASMCGGSIYYSGDISVAKPEFRLVYDFGTCVGASVFTLTKDDNFMFLPISGIQVSGDPTHDRDYQGEHDRRIAVLDLRPLMAKGNDMSNVECNMSPDYAWANVPYSVAQAIPDLMSPLGQGVTLGAGIFPYNQPGDANDGGRYWPNNSASDCPLLVDNVDFSGDGDDHILGTADDHPDNETSRGGPHFTVHDRDDNYIATSNYFVDLRNYAIKDVGLLLEAVGLGQAWCDADISANTASRYLPILNPDGTIFPDLNNGVLLPAANGHSHPAGGANDGDYPAGGLGNIFDALGVPGVPAALLDPNATDSACAATGMANILPGSGSVGDDTICMMRWNRSRTDLVIDDTFNAGDPNSPTGCIDMDFGDTGAAWPANGTRNPGAGNAKVHGMSFFTDDGQLRFFTNGTGKAY